MLNNAKKKMLNILPPGQASLDNEISSSCCFLLWAVPGVPTLHCALGPCGEIVSFNHSYFLMFKSAILSFIKLILLN